MKSLPLRTTNGFLRSVPAIALAVMLVACSSQGNPGTGSAPTHGDAAISDGATTDGDVVIADGAATPSESSSASSLQCGGAVSGAGTEPCIAAGGVCLQFPSSTCCDFVTGFDPVNSGCPHAAFAIRCCVPSGDAGSDVASDGGTE